jgi:hypothetical protein
MPHDIPDGLIAAEKSVYFGAPVVISHHCCQSCAQNILNDILQPPSSKTLCELTAIASNPVTPVNRFLLVNTIPSPPPRVGHGVGAYIRYGAWTDPFSIRLADYHPPFHRFSAIFYYGLMIKTVPSLKSSM